MTIFPRVGSTLGCCGVLVVAALVAGGGAGAEEPPPGATPVPVTAGAVSSGIDGTLDPVELGSISGRVLESGSRKPLVALHVYASADGVVRGGENETNADGRYTVKGLPPSHTGYEVCFVSQPGDDRALGGDSTTGWVPECYHDVVWAGDQQPRPGGTTRVRVIVRSLGAPHYRNEVRTNQRSHYTVRDLPPSAAGYRICFAMASNSRESTRSATGRLRKCYRSHGSSAVHLRPGRLRKGVDADLHVGGAVSGTVTDRIDGDHDVPWTD